MIVLNLSLSFLPFCHRTVFERTVWETLISFFFSQKATHEDQCHSHVCALRKKLEPAGDWLGLKTERRGDS